MDVLLGGCFLDGSPDDVVAVCIICILGKFDVCVAVVVVLEEVVASSSFFSSN